MLFRFRRYRVFLIFAFILAFTLVRLSRNRDWGSTSKIVLNGHPQNPEHGSKNDHLTPVQQKPNEYLPPSSDKGRPVVDSQKSSPKPIVLPSSSVVAKQALPSSELQPSHSAVKETPQTESTPTPTIPDTILPDRRPISQPLPHNDDEIEELHAESPGKVEPVIFNPYPTPIHWERQKEHFPVPLESLIKLPTGAPKPMPKIQFKFADESTDAKIKREARQSRVKEEFKLAWSGYKAKAWRHDEIRPVSGTFRDPFAGWAATLVDSLDTLWIMGLKEEFDEAVKAVETIDFTTSTRNDIQMFEVTIRYLGGMLAAYDVSGGKYKILLSKAVELADIMMGAFDTPNRMPVLYYNWKPVFASQPHRASARASLAELGSLSMEFTRLAQLTHEDKYYDAVARITNALEEYQNRGTRIEGVFPDNVDATGCNHTATTAKNLAVMPAAKGLDSNMEPIVAEGYQAPMPDTVAEPRPNKVAGAETLQFEIIPGQPSKGHIEKLDDPIQKPRTISQRVTKREVADNVATNTSTTVQSSNITSPSTTTPNDISPRLPGGTVTLQDWDCVKQGLDSPAGVQSFSMGGGQDSTYEYFTKVSCLFPD
jgi:mannosyl-oligosaccharide alpha-1,2-mannosidase